MGQAKQCVGNKKPKPAPNKPLTTIGKKDVQVAIVSCHNHDYSLNHAQGTFPIVNGATINEKPCPLSAQDVVEFSVVKMRFVVG